MMDHLELLKIRVARLFNLVELNAPEFVLNLESAAIVRSLTILWPGMWAEFGETLQQDLRNRSGTCSKCGKTEIPASLTHPIECRACSENLVNDLIHHGADPYAPNAPEIEEILVSLSESERAKVNNVDEDFLDSMELLLEARRPKESD